MKIQTYLFFACAALAFVGCGGGNDTAVAPPVAPPPAPQQITSVAPTPAPAPNAPPTGLAPAAPSNEPDTLGNLKNAKDGSTKTDLEALQAVVDGYSFGIDGLGAQPIASLDVLVSKGLLKKIPAPPPGKKWAYDSAKWKVSLVDQ